MIIRCLSVIHGMPKKIADSIVAAVVELLLQGISTKEIAEMHQISTTSVNKIRRKEESNGINFPAYQTQTNYSSDVKKRVIELLLEGKTPTEVEGMTGVFTNTIISWRTIHKRENGVEFPDHRLQHGREPKVGFGKQLLQGFKYTDSEIIELARLNPGFGISRFCQALYPKRKSTSKDRYRVTMILNEHMSETGEDLYDLLQDESFMTMVSEKEYKEITGAKHAPRGHGRATGGRTSKLTRKQGAGEYRTIPLPPQEFNWGEFADDEGRVWKKFERVDS